MSLIKGSRLLFFALSNVWPLNSSVNRSLGSSVRQAIADLANDTPIGKVTIKDRP
jgi:hypothetical protein